MEKKIERSWHGHGKKECLEAIEAAYEWILSKKPDRIYDDDYMMRYVGIAIGDDKMIHWLNDLEHGVLCDLVNSVDNRIKTMDESEFFGIYASYTKEY